MQQPNVLPHAPKITVEPSQHPGVEPGLTSVPTTYYWVGSYICEHQFPHLQKVDNIGT